MSSLPPLARGVTAPPGPAAREPTRRWDSALGCSVVNLQAGGLYVTGEDEVVSTVLGSCVAACIRDPGRGVGGLNHFLLPLESDGLGSDWETTTAGRYGSYAMERLINEILERGGRRGRLEVKLFGGARILDGVSDVGEQNVRFVEEYLRLEGLPVAARDVGGLLPRRIQYFPRSGRVRVRRLRSLGVDSVARRERALLAEARRGTTGRVEIF